jgi:hypothetical protein
MTAPAFNRERLAELELRLEMRQAALRGMSDTINDARDRLLTLRTETGSHNPFPFDPLRTTEQTEAMLAVEHARLVAEPKAHQAHEYQCRLALAAARNELAQQRRIQALMAERDLLAAEVTPLQRLVAACRRYADEGNFLQLGRAA